MFSICLINQYAGHPNIGMEFRPFHIASSLSDLGNDVLIITSDYSHLRKDQFMLARYQLFSFQKINGVKFLILRNIPYRSNGIIRALGIILFSLQSLIAVMFLRKFDFYIASSTHTLDFLPFTFVKLFYRKSKLIFEPHDLWPLALTAGGHFSKSHPFVRLLQLGEDVLVKYSNKVISMHPHNNIHLKTRGMKDSDFFHIPNGISPKDYEGYEEFAEIPAGLAEFIQEKELTIIYAGSVSAANGIQQIIKTIEVCRCNNLNVGLVVFGGGNKIDDHYEQLLNNSSIYFGGRVKKSVLSRIYSLCDVGYCGFNPSDLYDYGISPNKLWEYMYHSLPILLMVKSPNDPVGDANAGITVSSYDPKDLVSAIETFISLKKSGKLMDLGENGRKYVLSNNTYEVLSKRLIDILKVT